MKEKYKNRKIRNAGQSKTARLKLYAKLGNGLNEIESFLLSG
jgi:hypothetical protein